METQGRGDGPDANDSVSNGETSMESVAHSSSLSGSHSIVSAVIHRCSDDSYMLRDYEGKGLWLPCTDVKTDESFVAAAQRLGFEVSL